MASHARVANELYHGTAKPPRTTAAAHCVRWPNAHGPVTRRHDAVRGPSAFSVTGLGNLVYATHGSRLNHDPFRSPGAWFACSVLEPNREIGDGAFRDLGRGGMLYILRAGIMTASSTRPHRTGSDSTRIQIRPSGKCDSNKKRLSTHRPFSEPPGCSPSPHDTLR